MIRRALSAIGLLIGCGNKVGPTKAMIADSSRTNSNTVICSLRRNNSREVLTTPCHDLFSQVVKIMLEAPGSRTGRPDSSEADSRRSPPRVRPDLISGRDNRYSSNSSGSQQLSRPCRADALNHSLAPYRCIDGCLENARTRARDANSKSLEHLEAAHEHALSVHR